MTTTFITKKELAAEMKQTKELDKLYAQMRANAEANKISETSFEDAVKRQYKPIVQAIDDKLVKKIEEQTKLLAIGWRPDEEYSDGDLPSSGNPLSDAMLNRARGMRIVRWEDNVHKLNSIPMIVGSTTIEFKGNKYPNTAGLAMLLTQNKDPQSPVTVEDATNYSRIIESAGLELSNDRKKYLKSILGPSQGSSKIPKLVKPQVQTGNGLLPSSPLSLYKMLNLRLAAYQAGNTGLRNEVIAIADELFRQKAIKAIDYKKIVNIVENVKPKKK